jgi:hypothetical protein
MTQCPGSVSALILGHPGGNQGHSDGVTDRKEGQSPEEGGGDPRAFFSSDCNPLPDARYAIIA